MHNVIPFPDLQNHSEKFTEYERERLIEFNNAIMVASSVYGEGIFGETDEGREWFLIPANNYTAAPLCSFVKAPDKKVHLISSEHNGFVQKDRPYITGTLDEVIDDVVSRRRDLMYQNVADTAKATP
tara:strand:- start:239 stop:619 length:381 start_codon:yes stop_codon:yes gene_type:complete